MVRLVASLHDEGGRIAVNGFYDDVAVPPEDTLAGIRALPFDAEEYAEEVGTTASGGEDGYTPLERLWTRPSCDVNGILSGYTGEGAKTVLPASAMAKVSMRLVPDQSPDRVAALLREHIDANGHDGVDFELVEPARRTSLAGSGRRSALRGGRQRPGALVRGGPGAHRRGWQYTDSHGVRGDPRREPAPDRLRPPRCQQHAPNEWFATECFEKGIETLIHLYDELASGQ